MTPTVQSLLAKITAVQRHILFWQGVHKWEAVELARTVIRLCRRQIWEIEDGHT